MRLSSSDSLECVFAISQDGCCRDLNLVLEPALVVSDMSTVDVQAAVRFAAQRGMSVTLKATRHQTRPPAHGAVLISTWRMNGVTIDAENRTLRIEPGVHQTSSKLGTGNQRGCQV